MQLANLRRWRQRRALSLRELEAASGVGASTINRLENGRQAAHPATARKLAAALNIDPAELLDDGLSRHETKPERQREGAK